MPSRLLNDLEPNTREMVRRMMEALAQRDLAVAFTCTYRSVEEQNHEYALGRTLPGKIVTYAKGGQSPHNFRMAADLVFIKQGYDGPWKVVGDEARRAGLAWGGDWKVLVDRPHVERKNWRTYIA